MASVGIMRVYDQITESNGDYCKVCFRTARERKLVTPVFFRRFLVAVNNCGSYNSEIKVCFICEGLARSAMKFHRAMVFGVELEDFFGMVKSEGVRDEVLRHFDGVKSVKKVCHRAEACEEQYKMLQATIPYSLECTDTLLVAVEDAPKTVHKPQGTAKTCDDVVILDDDELPPPTKPRVAPLVGTNARVKVREKFLQVKHPLVTGLDGNTYVPSLKLQILPDNILRSVSDKMLKSNVMRPNRITLADKKTEELTVGYDYQDFLRQQDAKKTQEIIRIDNLDIVLNFDDSESNSKKAKYENDPLDLGDGSQNSEPTVGSVDVENGVEMENSEKRPVLSNARVDWEDKIPMDVISFMDATDPNPDERIMQPSSPPLGVISNVHSIEDDDVQIIENRMY